MTGLQQTYLFFCTGTRTRGQGVKDWDVFQEKKQANENKSENKQKNKSVGIL